MKSSEPKYSKIPRAYSVMLFILMFTLVGCPDDDDDDPILEPTAKFEADRLTVLEGDTIHFIDRSRNDPSSWLWLFGDGNTSTDQEPAHVYNLAGTYTVELTAENEGGTNSLEKPDYITIIEAGTLTDDRDGNTYKTVEIGDQVWMAENLKYLPSVAQPPDHSYTDPLYYVYSFKGTDVNAAIATEEYVTYGVLYNWPALMNGELSGENIQGVCPAGWHVPSTSEWGELIVLLGGEDVAGGKLKEDGLLHWGQSNIGATNETGFTALPGGGLYAYTGDPVVDSQGPSFWFLGGYGNFWTSNEKDEKIAWYHHLNAGDVEIDLGYMPNSKGYGLSVRCIQDE